MKIMRTPDRKQRTRVNDPEGLKSHLLDVAYTAFHTNGYHATALHDVRREAGVTGGALSHHYPTKKELGLAVIRQRVSVAVDRAWNEPVRSAPSAAAGIAAAFAGIIKDLRKKNAVTGCPLSNLALELSLYDPDLRAEIDAIFQRWRDTIADKLRAEQRTTELGLDPRAFATLVVASYSGAMALAKATQSITPLNVCAEQIRGMLEGASTGIGRQGSRRTRKDLARRIQR